MIAAIVMFAAAAHTSARSLPDACHVLTKSEIAAVQGEAFTDAKLTTRGNTTTCFYQLPSFTSSVSVDVTRTGAKELWEQHFEHEGSGAEPEEKVSPPLEVSGVGNEAFWVGSRSAGSLYVLKGDAMLRVSVGGQGSDKEKIARSTRLARRALRRL